MDELDKRLTTIFTVISSDEGHIPEDTELLQDYLEQTHKAFQQAGYIKLPGNAKNVTITTSDNAVNGKLMTEQEWREKFNA